MTLICIITDMTDKQSELIGKYNPENPTKNHYSTAQKLIAMGLSFYFHAYHGVSVDMHPDMPKTGPFLSITSHFSLLDSYAMIADPYRPPTISVAKKELMDAPLVGRLLREWNAIPVDRNGADISAVRKIFAAWNEGRGVGIAAEGTRNKLGRLGTVKRSVVELAINAAKRDIPIFPAAINGTYEALPPGARIPRFRSHITFITGPLIDLTPWTAKSRKELTEKDLVAAGIVIRRSISVLLPLEHRPLQ